MKSCRRLLFLVILGFLSGPIGSLAADYMVDTFESGTASWAYPGTWAYYSGDSFGSESTVYYAGTKSLRVTQVKARETRYFTMIRRASPFANLSAYDRISVWCRTAAQYGPQTYWGSRPHVGVKLYLQETSGERWSSETITYPSTTWGKVEYLFSQLTVPEDTVNGVLDLNAIAYVWIAVFSSGSGNTVDPVYYFDNLLLSSPYVPSAGELFKFEQGIDGWTAWNSASNIATISSASDAPYVHEGNRSLCLRYDQSLLEGNPADYFRRYATANARPYWTNWSAYSGLSFWLRSGTDDTNKIHVVIQEQSGQKWQQTHKVTATTGWSRVKAYFDVDREHGFSLYEAGVGEKGNNAVIDREGITNVFFRIDKSRFGSKAPPVYSYFYIDDVALLNESIPSYTPPSAPGLFDFEDGNIGLWTRWNLDLTAMEADSSQSHSGGKSLAFSYNQGATGANWMYQVATMTHTNPIPNWSAYKQLLYWVKGSEFSSNTLSVKLVETNGQEWIQRKPALVTNVWREVRAILLPEAKDAEGFKVNAYGQGESGNNAVLDLNMIGQIVFEANKQTLDAKTPEWTTFYVDDVALSSAAPAPYASLSVDGNIVGFGSMFPVLGQYRFVSTNSIKVSWETSGLSDTYWGLFAYSKNAENRVGLRGLDAPEYGLQTRLWMGPNASTVPPDPMNKANWTNLWGSLADQYGELNPLLDTDGEVPAGAVGSFQLHFAVHASGSYTQDYSAPVTIELRIGE